MLGIAGPVAPEHSSVARNTAASSIKIPATGPAILANLVLFFVSNICNKLPRLVTGYELAENCFNVFWGRPLLVLMSSPSLATAFECKCRAFRPPDELSDDLSEIKRFVIAPHFNFSTSMSICGQCPNADGLTADSGSPLPDGRRKGSSGRWAKPYVKT